MTHLLIARLTALIYVIPISLGLESCAQSKSLVLRSYAYYVERLPGNIPNDDMEQNSGMKSGNPLAAGRVVDTSIVIYVETKDQLLKWDTAWQNDQPYLVETIPIKQYPFHAGHTSEGKEVLLRPSKGNYLWQLQLVPIITGVKERHPITRGKVSLSGKHIKKQITLNTGTLKVLYPLPSV